MTFDELWEYVAGELDLDELAAKARRRYATAYARNSGNIYMDELHRQEAEHYPAPRNQRMDNDQIARQLNQRLRRELEDFAGRQADDPETLALIEAEVADELDRIGYGPGWVVVAGYDIERRQVACRIYHEEDEPREPLFDFYLSTSDTPDTLPATTLVEHVDPVDANTTTTDESLPARAREIMLTDYLAPDGTRWRVRRVKNAVIELECKTDPERPAIQYKIDHWPRPDWPVAPELTGIEAEEADLRRLARQLRIVHGLDLHKLPFPIDIATKDGLESLFVRIEDIEILMRAITQAATRLEAFREAAAAGVANG